ncbi:MAG: hypothetical protein AAF693_12675, partial [Bacteroidota bacterium]
MRSFIGAFFITWMLIGSSNPAWAQCTNISDVKIRVNNSQDISLLTTPGTIDICDVLDPLEVILVFEGVSDVMATVDWGDGNVENITSGNSIAHVYDENIPSNPEYVIDISFTEAGGISCTDNVSKAISINRRTFVIGLPQNFVGGLACLPPSGDFIALMDLDAASLSENSSIAVDWGDGTIDNFTEQQIQDNGGTLPISHTYTGVVVTDVFNVAVTSQNALSSGCVLQAPVINLSFQNEIAPAFSLSGDICESGGTISISKITSFLEPTDEGDFRWIIENATTGTTLLETSFEGAFIVSNINFSGDLNTFDLELLDSEISDGDDVQVTLIERNSCGEVSLTQDANILSLPNTSFSTFDGDAIADPLAIINTCIKALDVEFNNITGFDHEWILVDGHGIVDTPTSGLTSFTPPLALLASQVTPGNKTLFVRSVNDVLGVACDNFIKLELSVRPDVNPDFTISGDLLDNCGSVTIDLDGAGSTNLVDGDQITFEYATNSSFTENFGTIGPVVAPTVSITDAILNHITAADEVTYFIQMSVVTPEGCTFTSSTQQQTVKEQPDGVNFNVQLVNGEAPTLDEGNFIFCAGDRVSIQLSNTSSNNSVFNWTPPTDATIDDPTPNNSALVFIVSETSDGSSIEVEEDLFGCTFTSTSSPITVNPIPGDVVIDILETNGDGSTTDGAFCENAGSFVTLTANADNSGSWSYEWFKDGVTVSGATSQTLQLDEVSDSGDYTVTVSGSGVCATEETDVTPVTVEIQPALSASLAITSGSDTFCEGSGSVTLTATESASFPFQSNAVQWFKFDGSTFVPEIITTSVSTFTLSSQSGQYRVQLFGSGIDNCPSSQSNTIEITINDVPTTPSIGVESGFNAITCSDPNPTNPDVRLELLNASTYAPLGDFNFTWKNNGAVVTDSDGDPTTLEVKGSANDGAYTVEVTTVAGNCTSTLSNSINVTITDPPVAIPNIVESANNICVNDGDITLTTDNNPGGLGLEWFSSATSNFGDASSIATTSTITISDGSASDLYYFARFIADPTGARCEGVASPGIQVIVYPLPSPPSLSTSSSSLCEGSIITLTATPSGSETEFRWYRLPDTASPLEDGFGSVITGNTLEVSEPGIGQNYVALSVSAQGCFSANSSSISLDIIPLPAINTGITISETAVCEGESVDVSIPGSVTNYLYELLDNSNNVLASSNGNNNLLTLSSGPLGASTTLRVRATVDVALCNQIITTSPFSVVVFEPAPSAELITTDANSVVCSGDPVPLQLNVPVNARPPFQVSYRLNSGSIINASTASVSPFTFSTNPITSNTTIELVSVTDSEGCAVTTVSTNPNPLIITVDNPNSATLSAPSSVCTGDQLTVDLAISGGIGPFDFEIQYGANTFVGSTTLPHNTESVVLPVALTSATTVSLVSVVSANGCPVNNLSDDFEVSINAPQGLLAISDSEICATESPTLSIAITNGSGPYTLEIEDGDGDVINLVSYSNNSPITIPPAIIPGSGVETFTVNSLIDNSTGCSVNVPSGSNQVTLLVNEQPSMPSVTVDGSNSVCFGETVTLEGPVVGPDVGYQWFNATDLVTVIAVTKDLVLSNIQNADYRLRLVGDVGDSNCEGPLSDAVNVVISSLPAESVISVIGSTTLCDDGGTTSVTLVASAAGADSFEWFEISGPMDVLSTSSTLILDESGETGSYSVRSVNSTSGCVSATVPSSVAIDIITPPNQPVIEKESGLDDPFCDEGANSITLRSSIIGDSYRWYRDGSEIGITSRTIELDDSSESGSYRVSVVSNSPIICEGTLSDPRVVTIIAPPATPSVEIAAGSIDDDGIFCDDGGLTSVTLTSSIPGVSYNWYFDDGTGENLLPENTREITLDQQSESGDYSVEVIGTIPTSCASTRSVLRAISINEIPTSPVLSGTNEHCVGTVDEFYFVTPIPGATYNWIIPPGVVNDFGGSTGDSFVRLSFPVAGSFNVQLSVTVNDCESPLTTLTVDVLDPTTTSSITGEMTVCENTVDVVYSVVQTSSSTYQWKVPGGAFITAGQGTNQITVQFGSSAAASGDPILQVIETNSAGCESAPVQELISVNPNPSASIGGTFDICEGESFGLEINWSGQLPLVLDYSVDGVSQSTPITIPMGATNPYAFNVNPTSTTIYTLNAVNDGNGCDGIVSGLTRLNVSPAPQLDIGSNQAIPQASSITFIPAILSGTFSTIEWSAVPAGSGSFDNINATSPTFTPMPAFTGSITITAVVTDALAICDPESDDLILTVNAAGAIFAGNDILSCNGDVVNFVDAAGDVTGDYDNYTWSSNRAGNFSNPSINNPVNDDALHTEFTPSGGTGDYTITLEAIDAEAALPVSTSSFTLTVNEVPDALLINTSEKFICEFETATLTVQLTGNNTSGPWTIEWEDDLGNTGTESGITSSPYDFSVPGTTNESRVYTIRNVTENDGISCDNNVPASGSVTVTKRALPTAEIISSDINVCQGTPTEITVDLAGVGPWNIRWSDDGGVTSTQVNNITVSPFDFPVTPSVGTTKYTIEEVVENNQVSCVGTIIGGPQMVTINPLPTATISGSTTICAGQATDLTFDLTGSSPWSITYNDGTSDLTVPAASSTHVVSVSPTSTTTYTLVSIMD